MPDTSVERPNAAAAFRRAGIDHIAIAERSRGSGAPAAAVASKSRRSTTAAAAAAVAAVAAAASGAAARGHQRKMAARGRAVAPFAAPCLDMHQSYRV